MVRLEKIKSKAMDKFRRGWDGVFSRPKRFKDRVDLGLSPSTIVENIEVGEAVNEQTNDDR
jgi:hypothetical protein